MVMSKIFKQELDAQQVAELFASDDKCLAFLAETKWSEGFTCRKCGNTNSCPGKSPYSKRCTKCKTEESATAETIFHNCKFPISKAFYIAYHVCKVSDDVSTYEFARRLALRQMTCWKFKTKIQDALGRMPELPENERISIEKILTGK
jgi:hypothetical protein